MENSRREVKVWDLPLRLFHWTLVAAVALALISAEEGSLLNQWHVLSGWVVTILIAFRLIWGFIGGEHSRFADFIKPSLITSHISGLVRRHSEPSLGHNPLGAMAVLVLLGLAALTVWSGAFGGESAEELHEIAGWSLLAMVGVHVLAIVIMSLLEKENLVRAMITGSKPADRHPGATDARGPGPLAVLLALAVMIGVAYWIRQYDRDAFTLRSAESFEHRAGASNNRVAPETAHDSQDED